MREAKLIIFALHGYAQLANDFLNILLPAIPAHVCVVAPEALNRFYAKGFGGKPAATWMTSEEREHEISDYVYFLNQLYKEIISQNYAAKVAILGFSQGVATASRWIAGELIHPDIFIICSGDIALELINPIHLSIKHINKIYYTSALHDPLLCETAGINVQLVLNQLNCSCHYFEGGHEIHIPTLTHIFCEVAKLCI